MNLAGVLEIPIPRSTADIIRRTAVSDPVVVAEFFKLTMHAFFTAFLRTGTGECSVGSSVAIQEIYYQYGNIILPHLLLAIII
jgi:hypothetical protein